MATYQGSAQVVGLLKKRTQDYFLAAADVGLLDCSDVHFMQLTSWSEDGTPDTPERSIPVIGNGSTAPGWFDAYGGHNGRSDGLNCADGRHTAGIVSQPSAPGKSSIVVTGVFDGHGGETAARYAQESLMSYISSDRRLHASLVSGDSAATSRALKGAIRKVDEDLLALAAQPPEQLQQHQPSPTGTPEAHSGNPNCRGRDSNDGDGCVASYELQMTSSPSSHLASAPSPTHGSLGSAPLPFPPPPGSFRDGTTALLTVQCGGLLAVANVGDSRAVLSRGGQALRLSRDHTPGLRSERERIEAAGGKVVVAHGAPRVVVPLGESSQVMQSLSVSRSLGDPDFKAGGLVISEPDVSMLMLQPPTQPDAAAAAAADGNGTCNGNDCNGNCNGAAGNGADGNSGSAAGDVSVSSGGGDRFLIAASDGLWSRVSDQDAVDCVEGVLREYTGMSGCGCPPAAAARAAAHALLRLALDSGSTDDVTAVVCVFDWGRRA